MNCQEVQKYLSEFLDDSLEVERSQKVSDHLAACALCSEEMASLAECQRLVSGLPVVEPPVGFSNRVMAHVREAARKPSLWERLFSPFGIKIPLQATAVVLIAVLAAYIYQKEKEPLQRESVITVQPGSSFGKQEETAKLAPIDTPGPAALAKENKAPVQEFKDSAQLKKSQSPSRPEERHQPTESNQLVAPGPARSQEQIRLPTTFSPAPLQEKSSATSEAASPGLEQSSPPGEARAKAPPLQPPQPEKDNVSKDAALVREPLSYAETRERSAASSLDALRSGAVVGVAPPWDHELAIRLKAPVRDDKAAADRLATDFARSERLSLMAEGESKNLDQARQRAIQTGQVQTIWITVARNQYEPFKTGLAEVGSIETELSRPAKSDAVSKSSDQLRIKITIFPPPVSGNPASSQPSGR
jgi:Predicted integral membrane protein (DUF2275)/Putative zinc-finger